ncbi:MAG: right-handed parallel beta-helix repeat-containing protein [Cyclobacteriaceae bacterium]
MRSRNHYIFTFSIIILSSVFSVAQPVVINATQDSLYLFEDFTHSAALLENTGAGFGFSSDWDISNNGPLYVGGSSLQYPEGVMTIAVGGHCYSASDVVNTAYSRSLISDIELGESTVNFYISFLARRSDDGQFRLANGPTERFCVGVDQEGFLTVRAGSNSLQTSADSFFGSDTTYLVIAKYHYASNQTEVSMALFDTYESVPPSEAGLMWDYTVTGPKTGADLEELKLVVNSGEVSIDAIRLGSTYHSVIASNLAAPSALLLNSDTSDVSSGFSPTLSWVDNSVDEQGFIIFTDANIMDSVGANNTSYVLADLSPGAHVISAAAYGWGGVSLPGDTLTHFVTNEKKLVSLHAPADRDTLYNTLPYFEWSALDQVDPFDGYFEVMIDDSDDFSSPIDQDTIPVFINYYAPGFELSAGKTYYWRVRMLDSDFTAGANLWSDTASFTISAPVTVVDVVSTDDWDQIRSKWQSVLNLSETTKGAVELRFPTDAVMSVAQDPTSDESERENGFLLYNDGYNDVVVNGRGTKIVIQATHGEWLCGFMEITNASGIQVKDIMIDYHPNSTMQIAGVVQNFDKEQKTFEVVVDTSVYKTYPVLKHYSEGYFLSQEHKQRIGLKGVDYQMQQTWENARQNDTLFGFTCGTSEYGRYRDELRDGDWFVLSHRSGDIISLQSGVSDFVVNGLVTHASRGRFFAIQPGSSGIRCVDNQFLVANGRVMGSSSGGVGADRGDNIWYEGNTFEYTRDDMFHNGSNAGKGSVFRRNTLVGAFRNSVWVQADRTWVAENRISYAGKSGVHIGYAPSVPGTLPDVVLVEKNWIYQPNWNGIEADTDIENPDFETGSIYSENLVIRDNHIINNLRNEAIHLDYVKNVVVENNLISNTDTTWSVYSDEALQLGIHIQNSENVTGEGNIFLDIRMKSGDSLLVDTTASQVFVLFADTLVGPSDLELIEATVGGIVMEWQDRSNNETHFVVYRAEGSDTTSIQLGTTPVDVFHFTDTTHIPEVEYVYTVYAINHKGLSAASNEIMVTVTDTSVSLLSRKVTPQVYVYPNPSHTGVFQMPKKSSFSLMNERGRTLRHFVDTAILDLSGFSAGTYLVIDDQTRDAYKLLLLR